MMGGTHQKVSPLDWAGNKRVAELNLDTRKEHKEVWDGLVGEGQGLSDEDESRINDVAMDLNQVHALDAATVDHITVLEKPQHHSLAPIVQWERFLPLRTLKVLLVENDDSTRQVVSALLRNCCYEVTAVANGLEAWRVLQDLTNHIDLVLTEVVMPGWSGIGLLCKIMSHKTCKTIPVIMMSSNDSMGIVFKCLSKGAVYFLVKPIRKNELKNLWQHVWRRCHSSSGSGIQGQKFTKSKSEDDSVNNTGSNDEEGIGSFGLSSRNGSDNGSGTQSSWIKRPIEADSPRPGPHNSTCAQAIHPIPETFCCKKKNSADDTMGKDLVNESNQADEFSAKTKLVENVPNNEPSARVPDQLGSSSSSNTKLRSAFGPPDAPKDFLETSENKDSVESPSLELCLKKLRSTRVPLNDERNVLKHSNLSAFSRYPASQATVQVLTRYEDSSEATPQNQISYGSNSNDKCSTNPTLVPKPGLYKEASAFSFRRLPSQDSTVQPAAREKIDEIAAAPAIERSSPSPNQVQVQHHHHHYHHHHHHHVHASHAQQPDQDGSSVENLKENIACCYSSVEADAANYNLYGGNSGSNDGAPITAGGANMESAEKSGGDGSGGIIDDRFVRREAALNKFRQKRKERNFGKKVRYQSRKRLAEERPRVRGQFVRRIIGNENQEEDG